MKPMLPNTSTRVKHTHGEKICDIIFLFLFFSFAHALFSAPFLSLARSVGGWRYWVRNVVFFFLFFFLSFFAFSLRKTSTGKTSIIKRFVHNIFSMHYKSTIGVDFALKVINWDPSTVVRLQLWDIAGQERFGNMTRVYYREAVGAFVVFDVTRVATFEAVQKWKNDIDS